jgi:DNA repair photolyase
VQARFLLGPAGSGKTFRCLAEIRAELTASADGPPLVLIAPVLPGLSDGPDQLDAVVRACVEAGARSVSTVLLHLRPGVKEVFYSHLAETHPHLLADYRRRYRDRAYAPQADQRLMAAVRSRLVQRYGGVPAERRDPEPWSDRRPPCPVEVAVRPRRPDPASAALDL